MSTRWLSSIVVSWAPILTFSRRREAVLEWIEANTEPIAFSDGERSLGLAFGFPDMKLSFGRRSMVLSSGASGVDMTEVLESPLSGILDILTPAQTKISGMAFKMSAQLDVEEYERTTRRFAERAHGRPASLGGWEATDAAVLSDIRTDGFEGLIDYGVVKQSEILERVSNPSMGRTESQVDAPAIDLLEPRVEEAPPVSLFVDAHAVPVGSGFVASSQEIWQLYSDAEARMLALTDDLAMTVTSAGEGT